MKPAGVCEDLDAELVPLPRGEALPVEALHGLHVIGELLDEVLVRVVVDVVVARLECRPVAQEDGLAVPGQHLVLQVGPPDSINLGLARVGGPLLHSVVWPACAAIAGAHATGHTTREGATGG